MADENNSEGKSEKYFPVLGEDQSYILGETGTAQMRAIDMLRLESALINNANRASIIKQYCLKPDPMKDASGDFVRGEDGEYVYPDPDSGEEVTYDGHKPNSVPKDEFFKRAAEIIFLGLDSMDGREADFAEVRRALGKFESAGNEQYTEPAGGLDDLTRYLSLIKQKTNT